MPKFSDDKITLGRSSEPSAESQQLERLNRARKFFGDPRERFNNRLILERVSKVEEYRRGRVALILQCQHSSFGALQPKAMGFGKRESSTWINSDIAFVVLKAQVAELHPLKDWDEKLMLVQIVQVIEEPEPVIPSLVGFYGIQNKIVEDRSDLLLFKSVTKAGYKFFPSWTDWETSPIPAVPAIRCEEKIKCTPEVMERIANYQCATVTLKLGQINIKPEEICTIRVLLNRDSVKARIEKRSKQEVNIQDVLIGPFNL